MSREYSSVELGFVISSRSAVLIHLELIRLMISLAAKMQPPVAKRMSESPVKLPIAKIWGAISRLSSTRRRRVRMEISAVPTPAEEGR